MPIDQTMDRYWENGIEPFVVRPFPVRQRDEMELRSGDAAAQSKTWAASSIRLRHRLQRLSDSVHKRLFVIRLG